MTPTDSAALNLAYNTNKDELRMPEYGRHVQSMIAYCLTIDDKQHRSKVAQSIIDVIGNLNPELRDNPDYHHKLWDHLHVMSDFMLDVESPFERPTRNGLATTPEQVPYPVTNMGKRYYGVIIKRAIETVSAMDESEDRDAMAYDLANQMKRAYLSWNKDHVADDIIWSDLKAMSDGVLGDNQERLSVTKGAISPTAPIRVRKKKKQPLYSKRSNKSPNRGSNRRGFQKRK